MYINTFKYTPKDVSCQLCTEYVKKLGCTALRCPWLAERIEAGVVGYREAVMETFPRDRRLSSRLNLLIKHYPGSLWSNEQHERRMQYQCAVQGYRRRRDTNDFEVVIINTPLPDEFGHELGTDAVEKTDAGVILLAKTGTAEQIADKLQDFGVLVLAKPFTGAQFRQAVQIAASSYKRLAVLRTENAKLLDKIAQLRLVDRAKCYLIEKKGYTETDAHRLIEKRAMDTRRSRAEIAQEILDSYED